MTFSRRPYARLNRGRIPKQSAVGSVTPAVLYETFSHTYASGTNVTMPALPATQEIVAELWSGGEGGIADTRAGGGASYSRLDAEPVTASTAYAYSIGAAGTAGTTDTAGNTTWRTNRCIAVAPSGATGGAAASCTGDQAYSGGDGGVGTGNRTGGSSAGSAGSAVNDIPGNPDGGISGVTTAASGYGAGGNSAAASANDGTPGRIRLTFQREADLDFPYEVGREIARYAATTGSDVVLPDGDVGDILLAIHAWDGAPTVGMTGWTEIVQSANGTNCKVAVFARAATGSDPVAFTLSGTELGGVMVLRLKNCDISSIEAATAATGSSTAPNPPSKTPTGGSGNYRYYALAVSDLTARFSGFPASYEGTGMIDANNAGSAALGVAFRNVAGLSEDPGAFTLSGSRPWVAQTISMAAP